MLRHPVLVPTARRAGEELVPRSEQCTVAIDDDRVGLALGDQFTERSGAEQFGDVGGEGRRDASSQRLIAAQRRRDGLEPGPVAPRYLVRGLFEQARTDFQVVGQLGRPLPDGELCFHGVLPGGDGIAPRLDPK